MASWVLLLTCISMSYANLHKPCMLSLSAKVLFIVILIIIYRGRKPLYALVN